MDENSVQNMNQIMLELSESVKALNQTVAMGNTIRRASLTEEQQERLKNTQGLRDNNDAVDDSTDGFQQLNRAQKDAIEAAEEYNKRMQSFASALKTGTEGVKDLFKNLISQDPSRSMAKYGSGLDLLTKSISEATAGSKGLVRFLGPLAEGFSTVIKLQAEQADALHKANDSIAQLGTAGSFTINELREMANAAGVTSKNMDVLTKPLASLGPALTSLGGTTGDGVKAFAKLAAITNQQREEYQRLGVSQEQLMQNQADYIQLQRLTGKSLKGELQDKAALQKASLEYTDRLLTLSSITGENVESIKKQQAEARAAVNFQVSQVKLQQEVRALEAKGDLAGAEAKKREIKSREEFLDSVAAMGDSQMTAAVQSRLATGTYTEQSAHLARLGVPMEQFEKALREGKDGTETAGKFMNSFTDKMGNAIKTVGTAITYAPEEIGKAYGINKKSMQNYGAMYGKDMAEEMAKSKAAREKARKEETADPAQNARAKLTTIEIEAGKAMDKLVGASNILTGGFTLQTIAMTAFGVALVAATGGLLKMAGNSLLSSGANAVKSAAARFIPGMGGFAAGAPAAASAATAAAPAAATAATAATTAAPVAATAAGGASTAATAATTAGTALARLAGPLAGLAKAAPMIGTVVSVGAGVVDAYQGIKEADKDLKEGKITKEEAREKKGEAVGGGTGTAVGGAAGAIKGAALGASIGSVVPVLGTAVGGIIGAALGGWLGSKAGKAIGEVAGGGIAKMTADADKEVDKAKKEADKDKKEDSAEDKRTLKDKKDEIVKVSIVSPIPLPVAIVKGIEALDKISISKGESGTRFGTGTMAATAAVPTEDFNNKLRLGNTNFSAEKDTTNKSLMGTGSLSGMALGTMLGPLGMIAGGMIGSMINKPKVSDTQSIRTSEKQPPNIQVKMDKGIDSPFTLQKGMGNTGEVGSGSLAKQVKGMLDSTLPKNISQRKNNYSEEQGSPYGNLLQASDELTDTLVRLSRTFESASESLGGMTNTFNRFDMKLKRDLTRNIPDEVAEGIDDAFDAMGSAQDLRNQLAGKEPPGGAPGAAAPAASAPSAPSAPPMAAPPPAAMPQMAPGTPPPVNQDAQKNLSDIKAAIMSSGEKDEKYINAILGNVMKESGGKVVNENLNYGNTSNERIRKIFGSRASGVSDEQLNDIKKDPQKMGEFMYGGQTDIGRKMGNTEPGDGWKYRGRGYIQLTGKKNYADASQALFGDDRLVKDPDLVNDPKVASHVVAWYMQRSKSRMQSNLGIGKGPMTQEQANLLATSQVAGRAIKPGQGYTGGELLNKVSQFASSTQVTGVQPSADGGSMMASGPTSSAEKKTTTALAGSHSDDGTQTTISPDPTKLTAAADAKTPKEQVEKAGLKVRPYGDVYDGGLLKPTAVSVAQQAQQVSGFGMFTGLNDRFHQEKHPRSQHALGQGIDFVLNKMPSIEESQKIQQQLSKIPGVTAALNEYYGPPHGHKNQYTTGPHFHLNTTAAEGSVVDGPTAGYPVDLTAHGREVIAPLPAGSLLDFLVKTPAGTNMETTNITNNTEQTSMTDILALIQQMVEVNASKMDDMISVLESSKGTQEKLLQVSRV